jgi:hypothetical protein
MALDPELQKKLQIFMVLAIVVAGARAGYIVYERHEALKEEAKPKVETALKADYYVTPKKFRAYDLKSAKELTGQTVWVKYGYQMTYFPYDAAQHRAEFEHEAGTLKPLQKLAIQDVVEQIAPEASGVKQVLAVFSLDGKSYAVPIGADKGGNLRLRSDDMFFVEDPHDLYKHWPPEVWQKIDAHEVQNGMSELQVSFAIGFGVPQGSGDYGSRTLQYRNDGKPIVIAFENDKAVEIKPVE